MFAKAGIRRKRYPFHIQLPRATLLPEAKRLSRRIDDFERELEDCPSSGIFTMETKILENITSVYDSFSPINRESKPERCEFANQTKSTMQKS